MDYELPFVEADTPTTLTIWLYNPAAIYAQIVDRLINRRKSKAMAEQ